jgi:protein TonB
LDHKYDRSQRRKWISSISGVRRGGRITSRGIRGRAGGNVSAPILISSVEPEFSKEASKKKFSGNVLVNLWVDENGLPSHVHVLRGIDHGLDEKAVEAVKQYRFKPAMENGKPVLVELNVEVYFQIV